MKTNIILLTIIIITLAIIGFFTYKNYVKLNMGTKVNERTIEFDAQQAGYGIGDRAVCPEGQKATGGSCGADNSPDLKLVVSYITKSRETIGYNNAYYCEYSAPNSGHFKFTIMVYCQ